MNKTKFFSSLLVVALFAAATSVFTSCKDYDDDINDLQKQIDARALTTELTSLKSSLEGQLSEAKQSIATLQAQLATKANASDVSTLAGKVDSEVAKLNEKITALNSTIAGLDTRIQAIEGALAEYAKSSDLEALAAQYAALTGELGALQEAIAAANSNISAEEAARKAAIEGVEANIALQNQAIDALIQALGEQAEEIEALKIASGNKEAIEKLEEQLIEIKQSLETLNTVSADVADLKTQIQTISENLNKVNDKVNILEVLVIRRLTSLVLMPDFYWEGVEGIEIPSITAPIFKNDGKERKFTYTVTGSTQGDNQIAVTVKSSMGFLGTDNKIYVSELARADGKTWPTVSFGELFGDIETLDYPQAYNYPPSNHSLLVEDGKALLPADGKVGLKYAQISNGGVAYYHVNPTTAKLDEGAIGFFENNAEVYTRGDQVPWLNAKVRTDELEYNYGVLKVPFDVDNENLYLMFVNWMATDPTVFDGYPNWQDEYSDPFWWNWFQYYYDYTTAHGAGFYDEDGNYYPEAAPLPFLALQFAQNDTTVVTSDYAVVVPAAYTIVALADNNADWVLSRRTFSSEHADATGYGRVRENHLYESTGYNGANDYNSYGAIPMPATHGVKYNEVFEIDFVETHFDYTSWVKYGTSTKDQVMSEELMEQLGLYYEYTLVDYIVGKNVTGESVHMAQVDKNGNETNDKTSPYFAPRKVDEKGNTIKGQFPGLEAVGREPLIRVDLKDAKGNIIRYGYIKLRIVRDKAADMEVTIDLSDIYMNCGDSARVTWSQMEALILAKIGSEGMEKKDFEKNYYLDVYANDPDDLDNPVINDMPTNANGRLYSTAFSNNRFANRYYQNEDGDYELAQGDKDDALALLDDYTADNNWFGRVWYTPHDNSTTSHDWDEATNVLIWNFGNEDTYRSNMTAAAYLKMIEVAEASYDSKGLNTKAISTVVRFVNKNDQTSIWVTLKLDVSKVHFAYGDINNRVLDHWFDYKQGYRDNTPDTIEVYANVPTPAEVGQQQLTTSSFVKDLREYWLNNVEIVQIYDATHFDKFWNIGADKKAYTADDRSLCDITFKFRLPKKDENTVDINSYVDSKSKKTVWDVQGISGNTYKLYLNDEKNQIWALKNTDAGMSADELICELSAEGVIKYAGRDGDGMTDPSKKSKGIISDYTATADQTDVVNGAASDILNLIGMYDAQGKYQRDVYLTGHAKRTFAAYVEILVGNQECYAPLIGKNYFNVRFLRPINVWPAERNVTDALNKTEFINIWELLYIRDWRTYAVVMDKMTQKFGDKAIAGTGLDGKTYGKKDVVFWDEGNVPYSFYNITNLYVRRNEIRSDAYKAPADRVKLSDAAKIAELRSIDQIPALTNTTTGEQYLKIIAKADATDAYTVIGTPAKVASQASDDVLAYTNNGGVVKPFHIYVPIAVEYPWGALRIYTQTAWAVITVDPTVGNE